MSSKEAEDAEVKEEQKGTTVEQEGAQVATTVVVSQGNDGIEELSRVATLTDEVKVDEESVALEFNASGPETEEGFLEPKENDILNGRGAWVNAHRGNTKFRAICFARKPEFEAGNHAVKRRIAEEIVNSTKAVNGRFLKRRDGKGGPWYELSAEKAILKACQVMRDFQRPDRVALRQVSGSKGGRKRQRSIESTPGANAPLPEKPLEPIVENPFGVHSHDVLSGRGAFVNGHVGNQSFRKLAMERKVQFDAGTYSEKRALATEVVGIVRSLDPPGRFLKRVASNDATAMKGKEEASSQGLNGWEELSDDRAIHKACQVMRDIQRPDRIGEKKSATPKNKDPENKEIEDATVNEVVAETVMATEEVLDRALAGSSSIEVSDKGVQLMQV
mmetsp:Transcript_3296/g.4925  ORF Transcript_3296/g.4925 Transcript_3296/m.4925 type:complete len:389 (+) Transcript_3296:151-1317(+)